MKRLATIEGRYACRGSQYRDWERRFRTLMEHERILAFWTGGRNRRGRGRTVLFLGAWLFLHALQPSALERRSTVSQLGSSTTHWVNLRDDLLSIEAQEAPWEDVLHALRKKTGVRFHYLIPLEGSVTVSLKALPVRQALERLFGPEANFIFRYPKLPAGPPSPGLPSDVWILGKVSGADAVPSQTTVTKVPGESEASGSEVMVDMSQTQTLNDRADQPAAKADDVATDQERIDSLIESAKATDPMRRMQALAAIAESDIADEAVVRSALSAAVRDADANVRGQAIQALVSREAPDATAFLQQAMHDSDPSVRLMAVGSVVPDDVGIALLQEALFDADDTVRYQAAIKLKENGIDPGVSEQ